jgi:hypothetical protein
MDPAQFQGVSLDPVAGWIRLDRITADDRPLDETRLDAADR